MIDLIFSGRNLFILYLVLAGAYLQQLLPCNTSRFFMDNMWIRHILGFLTLIFFVVVTDTELDDYMPFGTVVATSIIIYFWFLISSKMTANWWMALVLLLGTLYIMDIYDERQIVQDPRLGMVKNGIIGLSLVLTLFGFLIYVGEKKLDYKSKFDYGTLLLGTTKCQGTPNNRAYGDSLHAAFFMTPTSSSKQMGGAYGDGIPPPPTSASFNGPPPSSYSSGRSISLS